MSARLLEDKVTFLTGGSTGIGWDCSPAYTAEGACAELGNRALMSTTRGQIR
jgi:NAD(P)-dependent dehydrogenase (short-subunit alcohol dehydrogenase family)